MKYILNSSVITADGRFEYRHITVQEAQKWIKQGCHISTIGYRENEIALGKVLNCTPPAVNRVIIKVQIDEDALVFRLTLVPGERRLAVNKKGRGSVLRIIDNCEIGILTRIR